MIGIGNQKRRKTQADIRWGRSLLMTVIIIALVVAASFGVTNYISHMEEEKCFQRLYREAGNAADSIELYAANDREELEMIAAVISQY